MLNASPLSVPLRLLALALCAGGLAPAAVRADIRFADVTDELGLRIDKGRAAWADLDGDGWTDLVAGGRIWRNREGRRFEDVTTEAGLARHAGPCVIGDFDGDGTNDLYLADQMGALYLGRGAFRFEKGRADTNTFVVQAVAAADFDQDGWIDLYLANYEIWDRNLDFPDLALRNHRGALRLQWTAPPGKQMRARGVTCCDFNRDGRIDLYVSNYRLMPNFLWLNRGGWDWEDVARAYGCAGGERLKHKFRNSLGVEYFSSGHTIGSVWADFDNDAQFDLFVGNFSHPPAYQDRPMLLLNEGPEKGYLFADRSAQAGIPWQESYGSPAAADVDNDGRIDLFYTTCYKGDTGRLFRNRGGGRFEDVTRASGIESVQTYQNAFADFDRDGRIDLLTGGRLYRNLSDAGHWLGLTLAGRPPNTAAIGAIATVTSPDAQVRQVEAGTGSGNQNDLRLHFGLGRHAGTVAVRVDWPDGGVSQHAPEANRVATLVQPVPGDTAPTVSGNGAPEREAAP